MTQAISVSTASTLLRSSKLPTSTQLKPASVVFKTRRSSTTHATSGLTADMSLIGDNTRPLGKWDSHLVPPSRVFSNVLLPTAQASSGLTAETAKRSSGLPLGWLSHVAPPSAVFRIVPPSPTAHAVRASTAATSRRVTPVVV